MSSHDLRLSGVLRLCGGVTTEQVTDAVCAFADQHALEIVCQPASNLDQVDIQWDQEALELSFDASISGYGGHEVTELQATVEQLNPLLSGPGLLEVQDFDTSSSEEMLVPHFLGPTREDRARAQVEYAFDAFAEFATQPLGRETVESLRELVCKLPVLVEAAPESPAILS